MAVQSLSLHVPYPPHFEIHTGTSDTADRWKTWKRTFRDFADAIELEKRSGKSQVATLKVTLGPAAADLFDTFTFADASHKEKLDEVFKQYDAVFLGKTKVLFERLKLFQRLQKPDESFEAYAASIQVQAKSCNLDAIKKDDVLSMAIAFGVHSDKARKAMMKLDDPTLSDILEIGKLEQQVQIQRDTLDNKSHDVDFVSNRSSQKQRSNVSAAKNNATKPSGTKCGNCGYFNHPASGACPARDQNCNKCNRKGHFGSVCRSTARQHTRPNPTQANTVTAEPTEDDPILNLSINKLPTSSVEDSKWSCRFRTHTGPLEVKLDTGAQANVMSLSTAERLRLRIRPMPRAVRLCPYGGAAPLTPLGIATVLVVHRKCRYTLQFYVIDGAFVTLLGAADCERLNLVMKGPTEDVPTETNIHDIVPDKVDSLPGVLRDYADCFNGLGDFGPPHHIEVDPNAVPISRPARPVPAALYSKVKTKLDEMILMGIIEPVSDPTPWCSNMTCVRKRDGSIRICIDPVDIKKAIRRPVHHMNTIEEIASRMPGAKYFTVLDADMAFWQVRLDSESSRLLTFATPFGRYKFLRLPFGTPDAAEVFQRRSSEFAAQLDGVEVIMDDFLIWGRTREEHDARLKAFMELVRKRGLKLKPNKIQYCCNNVRYCGHILSADGLKTDPDKVSAITNLPFPTNKTAVLQMLGMLAYLHKFVPNASDLSAPLRKYSTIPDEFELDDEAKQAVINIKNALSSAPTLQLFDVQKPVVLSVDASSHGLGAALLQPGGPVAYASRAMTSTQMNYAQIEKELLAVVFGCEKFDKYLFGKQVTIETDHKPLQDIFTKPLCEAPTRLQKMLMALQRYDLVVTYTPGEKLQLADALSRLHLEPARDIPQSFDICLTINVTQKYWDRVKEDTEKDDQIKLVRRFTISGWPERKSAVPPLAQPFWIVRHELSIIDGVLFRGERIVIPRSLRQATIDCVHEGHLGVEFCRRRARRSVYWPGMNADISSQVASCAACQTRRKMSPRQPMIPHEVPDQPFTKLGSDFYQIGNKLYVIFVDYTTGYIITNLLRNGTSGELISCCKQVFRTHGIPMVLMSDNGSAFFSTEFSAFAEKWGFAQVSSSPAYPRSNGLAENAVATAKRILSACHETGDDVDAALLNLNTAPREDGFSPAERLMGRSLRTRLPQILPDGAVDNTAAVLKRRRQQRQKYYYDRGTRPRPDFVPGQRVVYKARNGSWVQATILFPSPDGPRSYVILTDRGQRFRRNHQHLRRAPAPPASPPRITDDDTDDDLTVPSSHREEEENDGSQTEAHQEVETQPNVDHSTRPALGGDLHRRRESQSGVDSAPDLGRPRRTTKMPARYKDYVTTHPNHS